jgi:Mlc titration factor MtfA (ptsG expression regulator)
VAGPWQRWKRWRRDRTLERRPIPDPLWQATLADFPFLQRRSAADLERLRELATLFLAAKEFSGAGGIEVTDRMAVAIAAQACLPVLELGLARYRGFIGIVVHPDAVAARREIVDDAGVVHHYVEELAGEAMEGGPLMLSWRDVAEAGASAAWGYNVVIHEFVHVLDLDAGRSGSPLGDRGAAWAERLGAAYDEFADRVDSGADTLLDPYGAEAIEEYFAVASEVFFVAPHDLQEDEPALYRLLCDFFRQDPVRAAGDAAAAAGAPTR